MNVSRTYFTCLFDADISRCGYFYQTWVKSSYSKVVKASNLHTLKLQRQGFKTLSNNKSSCQKINPTKLSNYKSNLLRKVDFLLKSFQVIAFFIPLEAGYLVITIVNFVYKWARQLFFGCHKMSDWFLFSEYLSHWWFNFIMVTWLYYFSK